MAQMLFYENVAPVSSERHKDLCIDFTNYSFAANVNSVPLTAVEMARAAREYTIVFAGKDKAATPVVLLGVEGSQNQYLDDDNNWKADYIPAFVRRYPFVFSQSEDGKQFTLCVDESFDGCNNDGNGQRLFDEKGEQTEFLKRMLTFLSDYQSQVVRTQQFCNMLNDNNLVEAMQAQITLPGGEKRSIGGFLGATRDRVKALEADKLVEFVKTDALELTYLHLSSLNNLGDVINRSFGTPEPAEAGA